MKQWTILIVKHFKHLNWLVRRWQKFRLLLPQSIKEFSQSSLQLSYGVVTETVHWVTVQILQQETEFLFQFQTLTCRSNKSSTKPRPCQNTRTLGFGEDLGTKHVLCGELASVTYKFNNCLICCKYISFPEIPNTYSSTPDWVTNIVS